MTTNVTQASPINMTSILRSKDAGVAIGLILIIGLMITGFEIHGTYQWLGFGAKTAVGYGAMEPDQEAEARRQQQIQPDVERRGQNGQRGNPAGAFLEQQAVDRRVEVQLAVFPEVQHRRSGVSISRVIRCDLVRTIHAQINAMLHS